MERRVMGKTGMEVSVLGFGGAEIGYQGASLETVERLLGAALDTGLNVIDTAECYADSEEKIGHAVAHRREEFFLFTKCGHGFQGGPDLPDWSVELLRQSIDNSLRRLRTDTVDLIQLHSCSAELLEAGEVIQVLQEARAAGKTRFIGYSGDGRNARRALELGVFDTLQTSVNLADQEALSLTLPLAKEQGVGVIAKRPIANAAWLKPDLPEDAYARPYLDRLNKLEFPILKLPPSDAVAEALRFTLSADIHVAIVGTQNPNRWADNARAALLGSLPWETFTEIRRRWAAIAGPDWVGQT